MKTIRTVALIIVFQMSFAVSKGQGAASTWDETVKAVERMNDSTDYDQITALVGEPYDEFVTPSLPEEYVLYFDVPGEPGYMYWIMLDTEHKKFLYWGGEKQKKE